MKLIRNSSLMLALALGPAFAQTGANDPAALARHAVELQQVGKYAEAADSYRALLKLVPDDIATHVNLGVVLVNLGRYDEAIAEYEAAGRLLPGDPRIALNLALAYEKSGRLQQAAERFETLHNASPDDPKITMLLADCRLQTGDDARVIELLQPLAAHNPDDLGLAYMLGMALLHKQRIPEGQVFLDRILGHGDTAEARFLLGTRMFESGDFPAAVKQLQSAIELNPSLPQLQSLYGQALLNTGDPDAAVTAFQSALAQNSNDYAASLGVGQICTARRQFQEAVPYLQKALLLRPQSEEAKLALAQSLSGAGQFREARPYAESTALAMPGSAEAHETLSSVYTGLHLTTESNRERKTLESIRRKASASDPGPKLSQLAPDFKLAEVATGKQVGLRQFQGKSPVVLVFGSYSCPNFRSSAGALKSLYDRYGSRVPFLLVYIREAHSTDRWQSTRNVRDDVNLAPAATLAEKSDHATMCSRKLHLPFTALVDGMDGRVETAYAAWPSRAFVVGEDGRILYSTRLTELDFHAEQMDSVLHRIASMQRVSKVQ